MMMSSSADLFSAKASVIWVAALFVVLIFHCSHLIHMRGERRWYHTAHVVMLLGMLYMYAAVAFGLDWFPAHVWMIIYVATSAAIVSWMLVQYEQRRTFGFLWILALVQQGAMIYMWMPMAYWMPRLSYAFAVYFALEAIAWLMRAYIKPRTRQRTRRGRWIAGQASGAQISLWRYLHDHHGRVHGIHVRRDAVDDGLAASIPAVRATATAGATTTKREPPRSFRIRIADDAEGAKGRRVRTLKAPG
ncbi:MAG TPA: hypothetical protein VL996_07985 [Methylocella sp.]|nr:hypothetical protein [Methylocella sp.]